MESGVGLEATDEEEDDDESSSQEGGGYGGPDDPVRCELIAHIAGDGVESFGDGSPKWKLETSRDALEAWLEDSARPEVWDRDMLIFEKQLHKALGSFFVVTTCTRCPLYTASLRKLPDPAHCTRRQRTVHAACSRAANYCSCSPFF